MLLTGEEKLFICLVVFSVVLGLPTLLAGIWHLIFGPDPDLERPWDPRR
jgi:hypothetical protein